MPEQLSTLRARWVLPIIGPPVAGGYVAIQGGEVAYVDTRSYGRPARDLGNVAILPGFFNVHTHLEFSDLTSPLGTPSQPLPQWIGGVVAHRRAQAAELGDQFPAYREEAIRRGMQESVASGVTFLCEVATKESPLAAYDSSPAGLCVLYEILGLNPARSLEIMAAAERFIDDRLENVAGWQLGLSPHAPYTVSLGLLQQAVQLAESAWVPLAMHLAESREEIELLSNHSGPFREVLEKVGAWFPEAIPRGTRPLDFLQALVGARRNLVIHGNYLAEDELDYLAENSNCLTLVHCPRTHSYFGHPRFPLAQHLQRGISIAIGTDSRASNPDLDFLAELRFLAAAHPDVAPLDILRLGTYAGAQANRLDENFGSLYKGCSADLIAIEIAGNAKDPAEAILGGSGRVVGVMRGGQWIIEPPA